MENTPIKGDWDNGYDAPNFKDFSQLEPSPGNAELYFAERDEDFELQEEDPFSNTEEEPQALSSVFKFNAEVEQHEPEFIKPRQSLRSYALRPKKDQRVKIVSPETRSPITKKPRKSLVPIEVTPAETLVETENNEPTDNKKRDRRRSKTASNAFVVTHAAKPRSSSAQKISRKRTSAEITSNRSLSFSRDLIPRKVTKVAPFHFAPSRPGILTGPVDEYKPLDFKATLRRNAKKSEAKTGVTRVQPFHLNLNRNDKRKREPVQPFISMAEQIKKFESQTPARFRVKAPTPPPPTLRGQCAPLTNPVSPKLRTGLRGRYHSTESQLDREARELEEIKKYRFRANPVDPKIYAQICGIPLATPRETTKPVGMKLCTESRMQTRTRKSESDVFEFHARPAPKKILEGVVGLGKKVDRATTKAKSPQFALKQRQLSWKSKQDDTASSSSPEHSRELRPRPKVLVTSKPPTTVPVLEKKHTLAEPFSFHVRDIVRFCAKEEKIRDDLKSQAKPYEFRAKPLPSPSAASLPSIRPKPPTEPNPFQLLIDQRGELNAARWQNQVEQDLKQQREAMEFHAQPCTVVKKAPFLPSKVPKPLLEASNIVLNTDLRAAEREKFDEELRLREQLMEEERQQREMEQEAEEQKIVHELRSLMVHKANPVRHFLPVIVKPSEKAPTKPMSPKFLTTTRAQRGKENCD